jgi:UDP-glucose 4-epimerase
MTGTPNVKRDSVPTRWLITGGCGFIGTSLIKRLLKDDLVTEIRVLDNLSVGTRDDLASVCDFTEKDIQAIGDPRISNRVHFVVGDILDVTTAESCCQNMDIIVHLAASTGVSPSVNNPRLDMETNVVGTLNMLEGSRKHGVEYFVFASSGATLGEVDPPIHEKLVPKPVSPYGASKLAGEAYCSAYYRTFGIKTVILRFGNVYGPQSNHKDSVVARFIKCALSGNKIEIFGDGNQTRDFIYIDDLLNAILCTSRADLGGEVFQIASQRESTVNEIAEQLRSILEVRVPEIGINIEHCQPRIGDVKRNFSNTAKAQRELGWISRRPLHEGLEATVKWFIERHKGGLENTLF